MSWIDGPCNDGPDEEYRAELEETVAPERDDERMRWPSMGATHFPTYLANQREYPRLSRGQARD